MNLKENPIYLTGTRGPRRRNTAANIGTALFIGLAVFANHLVFLQDDRTPEKPTVEQAPATIEKPKPRIEPIREQDFPGDDEGGVVLAGKLKKGQSLLRAFEHKGLGSEGVLPVIHSMEKVFDFRHARVGDEYELTINGQGRITGLNYITSPLDKYQVKLDDTDHFVAQKRTIPIDVEIAELGCSVQSSLYASVRRCGEDRELARKLVDLLAWDVDFFQDVRNGDEIRLIVEKKSVEGNFLAYGNILGGEYNGRFGTYRFFWFEDEGKNVAGYFTEKGNAVHKEFLKTPLKYTRISSGYSHHRYHPVLHKWKKHLGIDYAAPTGSPVWAVATGKVTYVGKKGANGNLVAIRHDNGFVSHYAHLSRFARGLKVGDSVDQKMVIGFVGMTGRATGPHLHFGLKHNGRFINPQNVKFTGGRPVPAGVMTDYQDLVLERLERLQTIPVVGPQPKRA